MALFDLHKTMLQRPPSAPLSNFIFRINFFLDSTNVKYSLGYKLDNDSDRSMIAIKADLPSFETQLVQKHFLGTEKSFPILRKNGGETTLEFYTHTNVNENNFIVYNFFKQFNKEVKSEDHIFIHKEFLTIFNKIDIIIGDKANGSEIYTYHLLNCIPTKIDSGNVSYEGQEALKFTMNVHYDDWNIEVHNRPDEEEDKK
jgi:hypothetical protein